MTPDSFVFCIQDSYEYNKKQMQTQKKSEKCTNIHNSAVLWSHNYKKHYSTTGWLCILHAWFISWWNKYRWQWCVDCNRDDAEKVNDMKNVFIYAMHVQVCCAQRSRTFCGHSLDFPPHSLASIHLLLLDFFSLLQKWIIGKLVLASLGHSCILSKQFAAHHTLFTAFYIPLSCSLARTACASGGLSVCLNCTSERPLCAAVGSPTHVVLRYT